MPAPLFVDPDTLARAIATYPTPFHLYSEERMQANATALDDAMRRAGFATFRNFFAVKALPNPHVLASLAGAGQGLDCSSLAELELAQLAGVDGEQIIFSSNCTPMAEFERAAELGAIVNFDDISHIAPYLTHLGAPPIACCRHNPGTGQFDDVEAEKLIGRPSEAKYGMTSAQIRDAYVMLADAGVRRFGLHTMLLSNDLEPANHVRIAAGIFELAASLSRELGIRFEFINLGGGIGVPYGEDDQPFDLDAFATGTRRAYEAAGLPELGEPALAMENGRFITADAGCLVTTVIHRKETYRTYLGTDASMADLMRPAIYGAYHAITVLDAAGRPVTGRGSELADVTGSLCENNDKFAIQRLLPTCQVGDHLVIHTTGAHGHAMGFNYNGKLRSAEVLAATGGDLRLIRRAETLADLFATITPQPTLALAAAGSSSSSAPQP